jgi:hypothetical protein
MQFQDIRVLLRMPQAVIAPGVGGNFTAAASVLSQISGFSIWFFHNRSAKLIEAREAKQKAKWSFS